MKANPKIPGADIQDLIKRCIRNDRRAQLILYEHFAKTMYNSCYRIINDEMEAEDIVQESFLTAFSALGSYKGEAPFEAWLRRIVINRSLDHLRSKRKHFIEFKEDHPHPESEREADSGATQEHEERIKRQKLELIRKEAMNLPDGFRIVFSLYYYEGFDHDEIAGILGISSSTSRSQLARAKQKIIHALNPEK